MQWAAERPWAWRIRTRGQGVRTADWSTMTGGTGMRCRTVSMCVERMAEVKKPACRGLRGGMWVGANGAVGCTPGACDSKDDCSVQACGHRAQPGAPGV